MSILSAENSNEQNSVTSLLRKHQSEIEDEGWVEIERLTSSARKFIEENHVETREYVSAVETAVGPRGPYVEYSFYVRIASIEEFYSKQTNE